MIRRTLIALTTALALAACLGERKSPTDPTEGEGLRLEASATSLPASGFARITLTATLDPRTASTNRTVTFRTTEGTLLGTGTSAENGTKLDVVANAEGVATAQLQSSTNVGTAVVSATAGTVTKTLQIELTRPNPADIIRLSASNTSPPADGATVIQIHADIPSSVPSNQRTITFRTTHGTFVGGQQTATITADNRDRATVDWIMPATLVTARITATLSGSTAELLITTVPALPDTITVSAAKAEMKTTEEVLVTASLRRIIGKVTPGRAVTFTASEGTFRNVGVSGSDENATALYTPAANATPGTLVTIRATTTAANGSTITAETTVRLAP